jgi:hypothetical protein
LPRRITLVEVCLCITVSCKDFLLPKKNLCVAPLGGLPFASWTGVFGLEFVHVTPCGADRLYRTCSRGHWQMCEVSRHSHAISSLLEAAYPVNIPYSSINYRRRLVFRVRCRRAPSIQIFNARHRVWQGNGAGLVLQEARVYRCMCKFMTDKLNKPPRIIVRNPSTRGHPCRRTGRRGHLAVCGQLTMAVHKQ